MVDFNINLAKSMTSTPEERVRFYNRMLIYLVTCAGLMVGTAYLSSKHILDATKDNKERNRLISSMTSMSDFGQSFFRSPEKAYQEFANYDADLDTLRSVFEQRSRFLPVMGQLFSNFPDNISLQSLSASATDNSIEFELIAPVIDEDGNDVLRMLQTQWKDNSALWVAAKTVTQVNSEREMMGDIMVVSATYRCILK